MESQTTESKELRQCSRCHSILLLIFFALNRKGEYYKLCNNCRKNYNEWSTVNSRDEYLTNYYESNKETILINQKKYRDDNIEHRRKQVGEKIICDCGSSYRRDGKVDHLKTNKHKKYLDAVSS